MSKFAIFIIKFYQKTVSPDHGLITKSRRTCRFFPSCSEYAVSSFEKYSVWRALLMVIRRILKCHPSGNSGWDPVK